uniref:Cyclin-like domain-containing protein n=1 Tax=Kalanchoe fedtschenkoi TaxID=63787 RepID=A0A7N0VCL4_KALFE
MKCPYCGAAQGRCATTASGKSITECTSCGRELATHIGEVVINKCFCTRRNPISISAAAIYLACQLEDKRKTQAEICKVTGLTEVTLRKVYKELLENWDDLLPSNYTPAVPPEKAFPTTAISSGRSTTPRADIADMLSPSTDRKQLEVLPNKLNEVIDVEKIKDDGEMKGNSDGSNNTFVLNRAPLFWQKKPPPSARELDKKEPQSTRQDTDQMMGKDAESNTSSPNSCQQSNQTASNPSPGTWPFKHLNSMPPPPPHSSRQESAGKETRIPSSNTSSISWSFRPQTSSTPSQLNGTPLRATQGMHGYAEIRGTGIHNGSRSNEHSSGDK